MIPRVNLQVIFATKLRMLRKKKNLSLNELGRRVNLASSYLSELEQGQKFPAWDKMPALAEALDISYAELVAPTLPASLNPFGELLDESILQYFPFGEKRAIPPKEAIEMFTSAPGLATAFTHSLHEMARSLALEPGRLFYPALLRAYQEHRENYFEDIEHEVDGCATRWKRQTTPIEYPRLKEILEREFSYQVYEVSLEEYPTLSTARSICIQEESKICLNEKLTNAQKAFSLGREIGYNVLKLKERNAISPGPRVFPSFADLWNSFQASYFSGALLINRNIVCEKMEKFFQAKVCDTTILADMIPFFNVTTEMLFHRLTELLPTFFGIKRVHFLRFDRQDAHEGAPAGETYHYILSKYLNMSSVPILYDQDLHEHYCRRWVSIKALQEFPHTYDPQARSAPAIWAGLSRFLPNPDDHLWLCLTAVRPRFLEREQLTSITVGFVLDDAAKHVVRFWTDNRLPIRDVGHTCERCSMPQCSERAVDQQSRHDDINPEQQARDLSALTQVLSTSHTPRKASAPQRKKKRPQGQPMG